MYNFIISYKDFIELIIQLLVAIGTCSAVIVSLFVSTRQNRLKAVASVSIMKLIGGDKSYLVKSERLMGNELVTLCIKNKGSRPLILQSTSFYFDFKRKDKTRLLILPYDTDLYKNPITLNQGETRSIILISYENFLAEIVSDIENYKNIKKLKTIYIAGTGEKINAKIDNDALSRIIKDTSSLIGSKTK